MFVVQEDVDVDLGGIVFNYKLVQVFIRRGFGKVSKGFQFLF